MLRLTFILLIIGLLVIFAFLAVMAAVYLQNRQISRENSPTANHQESESKIEAIKRYRSKNPTASLKEAKEAVEAIQRGEIPSSPAPAPAPALDWQARVCQTLQQGQKIEAIKIYRAATGVGLKEAKEVVEAIQRGEMRLSEVASAPPAATPDWQHQVRAALQQGNKIEAIKLYREATGVGLKEAKEAVEALQS
jgi:ribosomal protein L7/L12